jgi:hypothetical protein
MPCKNVLRFEAATGPGRGDRAPLNYLLTVIKIGAHEPGSMHMKVDELVAIDTHTHAEVSCWNPFDSYGEEYDRAADKYFRSNRRPTIDETSWGASASPTRRSARPRRRTPT